MSRRDASDAIDLSLSDYAGRTRYRLTSSSDAMVRVEVAVGDELRASQVLEVTPSDLRELMGFFDELAADWAGWRDAKIWKLRDERTSLEARHDGLGHVTVLLRLFPLYYDSDWSVQATLALESGQLDAVARRVREALSQAAGVKS